MQVGIYARVSKADREDASSVPVQLADCQQRAVSEGWQIVDTYVDTGISAWNPRRKRPQFERLLDDVEAGRVDVILVREQERLLRQLADTKRVQDLAEAGHLRMVAATMESDVNFARARDRDDFRKRASQAQFYSDFLSEKIKATKSLKRAAGEYTGGESEPYGFRRVNGGLQIDPDEAAVIHDAVARVARGEPAARITSDLNNAGRTTAKGARWRPKTLRRLLLSDHLTGERGYPRILSDEEAAVVRATFSQEKRSVGRPAGRKHPLVGLLRCDVCGTKLTGNGDAYRCVASQGGCATVSIRALPLERWLLLESLRHWLAVRKDREARPPRAEPDPGALAELREIEQSLEETRALVGEGTMRPADAAPILRQLAERQAEAAERVSRTLQVAPEPPVKNLAQVFTATELRAVGLDEFVGRGSAEEFRVRWENREPAQVAAVRDLVASVVDHVVVSRRLHRGRGFDPKRVRVHWRS